jgi:hypothetical protein
MWTSVSCYARYPRQMAGFTTDGGVDETDGVYVWTVDCELAVRVRLGRFWLWWGSYI